MVFSSSIVGWGLQRKWLIRDDGQEDLEHAALADPAIDVDHAAKRMADDMAGRTDLLTEAGTKLLR